MPELPIISGDQCISALERIGYRVTRTKGSHVRMRCARCKLVTVIRYHALDRGTLRAIIRIAEITTEEFNKLLK